MSGVYIFLKPFTSSAYYYKRLIMHQNTVTIRHLYANYQRKMTGFNNITNVDV